MKRHWRLLALAVIAAGVGLSLSNAFARTIAEKPLEIGGFYKNLFLTSKSIDSKENYFADINRFRLDFSKSFGPWQTFVSLDQEGILHDIENRTEMDLIRSRSQNLLNWIDLDDTSVDDEHLFLRHSVYRAYVQYNDERWQATLGKQAVDWGRMRFFSPLDLFNPLGPIDLERDYRIGVDALNVNYSFDGFSGINVIAAPDDDFEDASYGLKLYRTFGTYDTFLVGGVFEDTEVIGFGFDGYLGDAGFRGEIGAYNQDDGREFARVSAGIDYRFDERWYFLFEQFYNGGRDDNDPIAIFSSYRTYRQTLSLSQNISNIWVQYQLNPLTDIDLFFLFDWDEQSGSVNPQVTHDLTENLEVNGGIQLFWGESGSEFGDTEDLYYLQFQWNF